MPEIDWTVLMQGYLRKRLYTMNENSFIHIFHQGYRRFALTLSTFLEHLLSLSLSLFGLALSLARNESVSQPTHFACAYTKKGNTHTRTHIQRTRTHRKWGRTFFGRFLHVYTYVYSIYIHIYILICLNTYQICHCCFYCVLIIIIHTHTHTDTYLFISINYIFKWYYLRDVANCLQRHVRWLLFHFLH